MSDVVVLASVRQHQQASAQEVSGATDDMTVALQNEAGSTTRPNAISAALSARRSIAVSALALARGAQASVLHLLR